jgi:hypothetical protein
MSTKTMIWKLMMRMIDDGDDGDDDAVQTLKNELYVDGAAYR